MKELKEHKSGKKNHGHWIKNEFPQLAARCQHVLKRWTSGASRTHNTQSSRPSGHQRTNRD